MVYCRYNKVVSYGWDEDKRAANLEKHGVDFANVRGFEWDAAIVAPDTRHPYGEDRFIAYGPMGERLYCLVFTPRGNHVRIISFRKANRRECQHYENETATSD